jgi:hypothetical protein
MSGAQRSQDFIRFVDYVYNFYGPHGVYPLGVTREQLSAGIMSYVSMLEPGEFCGDSVDRERVRDIMIDDFDLSTEGVF